jgi:hypothetical protein
MKRIRTSLLAFPAFALFIGCEAKVETSGPPVVEKKETTIVNPPAAKAAEARNVMMGMISFLQE